MCITSTLTVQRLALLMVGSIKQTSLPVQLNLTAQWPGYAQMLWVRARSLVFSEARMASARGLLAGLNRHWHFMERQRKAEGSGLLRL